MRGWFWMAVVAALSGCGKGAAGETDGVDTDAATDTDTETAGETALRVLHLTPELPTLDLYLDDDSAPTVARLPYGSGTAYIGLPAGERTLQIVAGAASASDALAVLSVDAEAGQSYSAIAFGALAGVQALLLVDDATGLASGDVRLQVSHVGLGLGSVGLTDATGALLAEEVDFGATRRFDSAAGPLVLGVDLDADTVADRVFDLPDLGVGVVDLFVVSDEIGLALIAYLPDGSVVRVDPRRGPARLRAIALSPDAPELDVFLDRDPAPVFMDVAYAESTAYAEIAAGTYALQIAPAGAGVGGVLLDAAGIALTGDAAYTVVAFDTLDAINALVLVDDASGLAPTSTRLQLVHAATGLGPLGLVDAAAGVPLVGSLGFAGAARVDVPAGPLALGMDLDADGAADLRFDLPALGEGLAANVFVVADGAGTHLLLQLPDTTLRVEPTMTAYVR